MKICTFILIVLFAALSLECNAQCNCRGTQVYVVQAPAGSFVPDVLSDNNGILHMVYVKNQNAYYVRSSDDGMNFSPPVRVNSSGEVEYKMGERGPKLAVGRDGIIHIAWMDKWSAGAKVNARYTRSLDGGKNFEKSKTVSATAGVDGVTVAAGNNNQVYIFWHTMVPQQSLIPQATWLHFSKSGDNGNSFSPDANLSISNHSGLACSMCMTRARFGADENVYLAFRSAENNIRDFYVLKSGMDNDNFSAVRVNTDNWQIDYCPMAGPELAIGGDGVKYCAFMSKNRVYWAVSDSTGTGFINQTGTPEKEPDEIYPSVAANNSGRVLFLWQVGPMSVSDSATVKWAQYYTDGTFTGLQETAGRTSSGTKASVFVGTDDNFYVVINGKN